MVAPRLADRRGIGCGERSAEDGRVPDEQVKLEKHELAEGDVVRATQLGQRTGRHLMLWRVRVEGIEEELRIRGDHDASGSQASSRQRSSGARNSPRARGVGGAQVSADSASAG